MDENLDENNLIDQLEDLIIDHPDAKTREDLLDHSLDQTFQNKLNARADQITHGRISERRDSVKGVSNGTDHSLGPSGPGSGGESIDNDYQFLIEKTKLLYEYKDYESLEVELSEWFTYNDLKVLGTLDGIAEKYECVKGNNSDATVMERCLRGTFSQDNLAIILYFALGQYKSATSREDQLQNIVKNSLYFHKWGLTERLIDSINEFIEDRISKDKKLEEWNASEDLVMKEEETTKFFKILTILYFILNVSLTSLLFHGLRNTLERKDILLKVVKFIEHWKWKPNSSYRIRSLIQVSWKLILVEFGDSSMIQSCDDFLCDLHGIIHKEGKDLPQNKLTCSPLDYFTFREDLMAKYPLFSKTMGVNESIKRDPLDFETARNIKYPELESNRSCNSNESYQFYMAMNENSNSLTNLIEIPRTNRSHTVSSQLPAQTVHIATPVPSPPSTPSDYMSGGEKIRKLYHLNQAMPFIYPTSDEMEIPYAIKEADTILKNSIYESYSNKQLWEERQAFMRQERGFVSEYETEKEKEKDNNENETEKQNEKEFEKGTFDYDDELLCKFPEKADVIHSLLRVESFYSENLVRLNSLIEVLVETIRSNKFDYDLNFPELELNPETSFFTKKLEEENAHQGINTREKIEFMLMQQLEVANVKEITLKACSGIIVLLLKWFKKNHILKYWYLTSLLFDQQYLSIMMDFLHLSFNNSNIQRTRQSDNNNGINVDEMVDYGQFQNKIMNPKIYLPKFEFFNNCLNQFPKNYHYEFLNKTPIQDLSTSRDTNNINNILIQKFNSNYCFNLTNILYIGDKILLDNKTQRILTLSDLKPSDMFKMILINFNNQFIGQPILRILKKLIPYQGRKWKSNNMELISQVYLHSKLSLRDSWLSGKDLENDFNNSYGQEIALRGLLQFYNMKKYPQQMEMLGYELLNDEFTALELNLDE